MTFILFVATTAKYIVFDIQISDSGSFIVSSLAAVKPLNLQVYTTVSPPSSTAATYTHVNNGCEATTEGLMYY